MTMIQIQTQVSLDTLMNSLKQLDLDELEQIAEYTARLRAQHRAPSLSKAESELWLKINQGVVPENVLKQCAVLTAKAHEGTITDDEHAELMALVNQIEMLNAERLGYLAQLAQLRQMPLEELMAAFEIKPLSYA
jgi:hypothetical protein